MFVCLFVTLEGKIYDPADIAIVNRLNGVDENELTDEVIDGFNAALGGSPSKQDILSVIGGFP